MISSIKARTPFLALILFVFAVGYTFAANKVVVIPLDSSEKAQWALIDDTGDIVAQSGGITVTQRGGLINYWVNFGRSVRGHAILVTPQSWSGPGFLRAVLCGNDPSKVDTGCGAGFDGGNYVFVNPRDKDGVDKKIAFYITVLP